MNKSHAIKKAIKNPVFNSLYSRAIQLLQLRHGKSTSKRVGGQLAGKIKLTKDFDEIPRYFVKQTNSDSIGGE